MTLTHIVKNDRQTRKLTCIFSDMTFGGRKLKGYTDCKEIIIITGMENTDHMEDHSE